jgi:glycoside/pentoside/hexuronide:cation symporter, GPH family
MLGRADGWRSTTVYGLAHLGKSLFWYASEILFAFYLTEQVGLPAAQMGIVLGLGLIVSAGIDLVIATRFRRTLSDAAATGRLQFAGSVLCAAAFLGVFLGFWIPAYFSFAYALAAGLAFRVAFALFDLPQNALMALATGDSAGRDRVASTRIWFSGVAILIVALAVGPLVADPESSAGAMRYLMLALLVGVPAVIGSAALAQVVSRMDPAASETTRARAEATAFPRPPAVFWLLMILMVVTSLATPIFSKLEPYFASFVIRSPLWGGVIISAMALGVILGQPAWTLLCRRHSRAKVMIGAAWAQIASLLCFWIWPIDGPVGFTFAAFVFGLGNGGVGMVLWGAFSEMVAQTAKGHEGLSYAAFTATAKVTLGLGGLGLGAALALIDYRGSESATLVTLMTTVPAAGAVVIVLIGMVWLRLDRGR